MITDEAAMACLARGDLAALDVLVVRHGERAQRIAYGVLRDASLAQDVVADCCVAVATKARRFDQTRPFTPWFHRMVVNRALNVLRARRWLAPFGLLRTTGRDVDPGAVAETHDVAARIRRAFEHLSPNERAVVVLRLVLDLSEADTARTLSCPVGTVKSRLSHARKHLREQLGEWHIEEALALPVGGSS